MDRNTTPNMNDISMEEMEQVASNFESTVNTGLDAQIGHAAEFYNKMRVTDKFKNNDADLRKFMFYYFMPKLSEMASKSDNHGKVAIGIMAQAILRLAFQKATSKDSSNSVSNN